MPQHTRRTTFMAASIAAPAVAGALWLSAIEGYRLVWPESPLFGDPPAASLAEAITRGYGAGQAYAFIRAGQDPNELITVDDANYTGGRSIRVSPLMLAVASRDSSVVQMLLNFGARLDLPPNRLALCFAHELGNEEIVNIIARDGADVSPTCPERHADPTTPLLGWVD